jgi:hypothetical protein
MWLHLLKWMNLRNIIISDKANSEYIYLSLLQKSKTIHMAFLESRGYRKEWDRR